MENPSFMEAASPENPPRDEAKAQRPPCPDIPTTEKRHTVLVYFDTFAAAFTRWAGSPVAFLLALASVLLWCASGPVFDYSEKWQLVINTSTTIITFLMVFLIQQSQNKDSVALQLKLDELLVANAQANNRMVAIEEMDEGALRDMAQFYGRLAQEAKDKEQAGAQSSEAGKPREPDARPETA